MKILVAYDGSEAAGHALKRAAQIAQRGGEDVTVISVVPCRPRGRAAQGPSCHGDVEEHGRRARRGGREAQGARRRGGQTIEAVGHPAGVDRRRGRARRLRLIVVGTADGTALRVSCWARRRPASSPTRTATCSSCASGPQSAAARDCAARAGSRLENSFQESRVLGGSYASGREDPGSLGSMSEPGVADRDRRFETAERHATLESSSLVCRGERSRAHTRRRPPPLDRAGRRLPGDADDRARRDDRQRRAARRSSATCTSRRPT